MNKIFRQMLVAYLTICTTGILLQMQALAEEQSPTLANNQSSQTTTDSTEMSQVTSVSQLSDVQPNDWGFNALQSLVERYGCIKGYPNQTFRGNRATTRFEFASGLNTCLNQINELITQGTGDLVRKEDLATIERLKEEFGNELAQVRGRLDNLESRIGDVEANQFSTTAKLSGQVVSYVGDILGKGDGSTNNTILGYRAIVGVDTSFTGKDSLGMSLMSSNFSDFQASGNGEASLSGSSTGDGKLLLIGLQYQFPLTNKLKVSLNAVSSDRILTATINALAGTTTGAVSDFASQNPLSYPVNSTSGIGVQWQLSKWLSLDLAAGQENDANDPRTGIFGGGGYLASIRPVLQFSKFRASLSLIHTYSPENGINTANGSKPAAVLGVGPVVANSYLGAFSYLFSPTFEIGGSVGRSFARALGTGTQGDADVLTYRVNLGIHDLGKKGNLAGIIFGMQPRLTGTSNDTIALGLGLPAGQRSDRSTGLHLEAFYSHRINDNITITPGIFWLTAPNHNDINPDVVVGVIRTAFTF